MVRLAVVACSDTSIVEADADAFLVGGVLRVGRKAEADGGVGKFLPSIPLDSGRNSAFKKFLHCHLGSTLAHIVSRPIRNHARTMGRSTSSLIWRVPPQEHYIPQPH